MGFPHGPWAMGVPISAYIFLTNRATTVPVIQESPTWKEGLALAMSMRTIKGTGIDHEQLIYNPLGMSTYYAFGLNDYLRQWFDMEKEGRTMPKIFQLNLFRRPSTGSSTPSSLSPATSLSTSSTSLDIKSDKSSIFDQALTPQSEPKQAPKEFKTVWPGFGDNIRLLAWIHGRVMKKESAIGKPFPLGTVVPTNVNVELYEAEQKFLLTFLEKTRGIVKESLGENKEQSSEPVKEEKSGGSQAKDGIQAKPIPEPKPELKIVPKEEPKGEVKQEVKEEGKMEMKGEEQKEEGKEEQKNGSKEESKEEGKEGEHKDGSREESREERTQPDSHKEEEKKD